jgi:tRNA-dihydrouridine synthase B
MGCPARKVLKRAAGSALLGDEVLVGRILETVVSSVTVPVTLKIRTGTNPENRNGVRIARIAESSGIQALAVHGRTRSCKFQGPVEFDTVRAICLQVSLPVFANGDIVDWKQAAEILKFTGASGVMIGRGAHGAPWFPGMVARYLEDGITPSPPSLQRQSEIVQEHLHGIYSFYGIAQGVRIARKHIKWYLGRQQYAEPYCEPIRRSVRSAAITTDCCRRQAELLADYYDYLQETDSESSRWQKPYNRTKAFCRTTVPAWLKASGIQSRTTSSI